jgi:hypothetical protein
MYITNWEILELYSYYFEFPLILYNYSNIEKLMFCDFYYRQYIILNWIKLAPEASSCTKLSKEYLLARFGCLNLCEFKF